jgi:hypothetical protein
MDTYRTDPDPVKVAAIVDGYGIGAALERWSDWSRRHLNYLAAEGREIMKRTLTESGRGQSARRLGGIDPPELDSRTEAWLSADEALRECGIGAGDHHPEG